jgi:hypothetical protein
VSFRKSLAASGSPVHAWSTRVVYGEIETQGLATALFLGADPADGKANAAGWLAIVGGDDRQQSTCMGAGPASPRTTVGLILQEFGPISDVGRGDSQAQVT